MKALLKELWGLFVDDGALAVGLLVWCAIAAVLLPALLPPFADGIAFFIGCCAVLLVNVTIAAWRARPARTHPRAAASRRGFELGGGESFRP